MSRVPGASYGRAAVLGVLIALLLVVCAVVYTYVARHGTLPAERELADPAAELQRRKQEAVLAVILLSSALLVLLFVVGCYLLIRIGRIVRHPVADKPTTYVDVWQSYRLTDEQIAAATAEHTPGDDGGGSSPDAEKPPSDPESEPPTPES